MDRIIEVKVSGNHLSKDNKVAGVRGEANVTNLHITFDEGWDGYAKRVTFWDALGNNPTKILIEDKREATVPIPGEAMTEAGKLTFVIDGYLDGKKQRSISDTLEVKDAPMDENAAEPIDPTPDLATQLQSYIDNHKNDDGNPHGVTADQSGALPIEGGTLEGNLEISNAAPIVDLKPKYESGSARLLKSGDTTSLADRDEDAFDNVAINISNSKAKKDLTSAVVIYNVTNGFASSYKLYGEHNKPKASDVGAYSKEEEDTKLSGKVDKVTGKGLSSNDFTDEHKTKLEGMDEAVDEKLEVLSGKLDEHKTDTKTALNLKADKGNVYTKSETDSKLNKKANADNVYTKSETDSKLNTKANADSVYTKTEADSKLNDKANRKDVYGMYEIDSRLNNKADKTTTYWLARQLDTKAEKSDIANVYKFEGSVDTFEDLPVVETSKPNGTPTRDEGYLNYEFISEKQEVNISGTFDSEWSTHVEEVRIPISDMELPAGYYIVEVVSEGLVGIHDNLVCSCSVSKGYGVQQYNVSVYGPTMLYLPTDSIFKCFNLSMNGDYLVVDIDAKIKGVTFRKVNYSEELGMNPDNYPSVEVRSVYNVRDTGMNYAFTGSVWDALGGEHRDIEAREQIAEISTELDKKADKSNTYTKLEANRIFAQKSDISNVYKFKGSVDTFDEELMTPATYEIIPKGNPTYNGVVVGTYDAENRTVTIDSKKLEGWVDYEVVVPIEEIVVPKGYYSCKWDISIAGMDGYWADGYYAYKKNNEEIVTTVSIGNYGDHGAGTIELGNLKKHSSVEVELAENPYYDADYQVIATLETGDVYNVLDSGMNYAWTGSSWDALGGEHKDLEAREMIGDIETALDSIIEIQNSLIGGDSV